MSEKPEWTEMDEIAKAQKLPAMLATRFVLLGGPVPVLAFGTEHAMHTAIAATPANLLALRDLISANIRELPATEAVVPEVRQ